MTERIIISNGSVVTMNDANDVVFDGAVVLDGDRITDVGPTADVLARTSTDGARVIDATGKAVLPGLVDLHYHTARSARAGAPPCRSGSTWRPAGTRSSGRWTTT